MPCFGHWPCCFSITLAESLPYTSFYLRVQLTVGVVKKSSSPSPSPSPSSPLSSSSSSSRSPSSMKRPWPWWRRVSRTSVTIQPHCHCRNYHHPHHHNQITNIILLVSIVITKITYIMGWAAGLMLHIQILCMPQLLYLEAHDVAQVIMLPSYCHNMTRIFLCKLWIHQRNVTITNWVHHRDITTLKRCHKWKMGTHQRLFTNTINISQSHISSSLPRPPRWKLGATEHNPIVKRRHIKREDKFYFYFLRLRFLAH